MKKKPSKARETALLLTQIIKAVDPVYRAHGKKVAGVILPRKGGAQ